MEIDNADLLGLGGISEFLCPPSAGDREIATKSLGRGISVSGPSSTPPAAASVSKADVPRTVNAWREQWRQLSLQSWSAESDGRREIQNPRSLSQDQLEELRSASRKADCEFKAWEQELFGGLSKVRKRVQALARNIHFAPKQGDSRRMVQGAEHDLRVFAEQARQQEDDLAALECSLQDTLEASLARFEGWCSQESPLRRPQEKSSKASRPPSCSRPSHPSAGKEAKEVDSMHEQLDRLEADIAADGGSTGGWSHDDHDTFLRVFRKFKRKTGVEFIAETQQLLPHKRHEDLIAHVSWMALDDDRQLQKRQLVEKWRCMKALAATRQASMEPKQELNAAAAKKEKQQRACSRERVQKGREEQRQRVTEWRRARDEEQAAQQAQEQHRQEQAKESDARERRLQADKKRQAVERMREQRAADEALACRPRSSATGSPSSVSSAARPVAAEDRRRIAERNAALLQKRASLVQAKQAHSDSQCFEPPPRASSAGAQFRHVESRLEEHTKAFVDRSRELREDSSIASVSDSKYNAMPGNFAHQGVVRTMRRSASWRPHFGV